MSQRILRALMQLFALIASPVSQKMKRRAIVESFLLEQLNKELVEQYIILYEQYVEQYQQRQSKSNPNKLLSVSAVKLLTICSLLNEELIQQQKIIVLIKLIEFIKIDEVISELAYEFISTVADSFKIPNDEFDIIKNFILNNKFAFADPERILVVNSQKKDPEKIKHIYSEGLKGEIYFLQIKIHNILIFYYEGEKELYLNQQLLNPERIYLLSLGSALRTAKTKPIYYNDVVSAYNFDKIKSKIVFEADKVYYEFKNRKVGIQQLSFTERSGRLVGIMGGSGSGKTTLLNLLNGNFSPTTGHIYINGLELKKENEKLNGFIGYVAQDDLLIEELTVYENLYYNAKLCFGNASDFSIKRKVIKHLKELGLYEIRDMKVGTVLNRKISGGQRKRLNIALELIREPPILFLDEPTSGLSSRDSENIMDLLKDLTIKGKLVFVVIHQPPSSIFKMLDRLLVLDQGGYLIFNGQPIEAIIFFKSAIREADWTDTVCQVCGSVNSEQIFNIIETRIIDEYGNLTQTRKFSPLDWYERFNKYESEQGKKKSYLVKKLPEIDFNVPSKIQQFKVFITRDFLSKLSSLQYLLINILETPIMALTLAFIIKFWSFDNKGGYQLMNNDNLPVYIFMSVIIAIFVGLSVSAQEIYKDRKMLQREAFLNLSRTSYLFSKMFNLLMISAYQSLIFVIIGNSLIEVSFMNLYYWIMLFSVWFSSNLLGLIISEAFKSSSTIYIIIPFLVIPQIILSGVLVPFDKLNPNISKPNSIPWFGELITARWAYEGIAVQQFTKNPYYINFYPYDVAISEAEYIKGYWVKNMENYLVEFNRYYKDTNNLSRAENALVVLKNEMNANHRWTKEFPLLFNLNELNINNITEKDINSFFKYLTQMKDKYVAVRNIIQQKRDNFYNSYVFENSSHNFVQFKTKYHNEKLEQFVFNTGQDYIIEHNKHFYRVYKPVLLLPETYFIKAHYYAPKKPFFGLMISTFWFNTAIIWVMSIILYFVLYYKLLQKLLDLFEYYDRKLSLKRESQNNNEKRRKLSIYQKLLKRLST